MGAGGVTSPGEGEGGAGGEEAGHGQSVDLGWTARYQGDGQARRWAGALERRSGVLPARRPGCSSHIRLSGLLHTNLSPGSGVQKSYHQGVAGGPPSGGSRGEAERWLSV